MNGTPGTVSKILWHFTGGPRWNNELKKQDEKPKPTEEAFAGLLGILRSRTLRVGGFREVAKVTVPKVTRVDPITRQSVVDLDVPRELLSTSVCCIADIPIMHLGYHAGRYGRFAIGFHRDAAITTGFNPVFYCPHGSSVLQSLYVGLHGLGGTDDDGLVALGELSIFDMSQAEIRTMEQAQEQSTVSGSKRRPNLSAAIDNLRKSVEELDKKHSKALNTLKQIIAFIKTFNINEFDTIYTEREWRSTQPFNFTFADVPMVVAPREGGFFDRLIDGVDSLGLPRSVSIVAWEDLVEH